MSGWNLKELKGLIENIDNIEVHFERIKSISRSMDLLQYHLYTAKKANDLILPKNQREAIELVFIPESKQDFAFETKLKIQANTLASIHTVRSIYDLFAQLVNGLLLIPPLPVYSCDFIKVTEKLPSSELKIYLKELSQSDEFLYINAFVNTIKHRNLVDFEASIKFDTGISGVEFKAFSYSSRDFPAMWAEDVLKQSLSVKNAIVTAGTILNKQFAIQNV
jgi:hypothetical protein